MRTHMKFNRNKNMPMCVTFEHSADNIIMAIVDCSCLQNLCCFCVTESVISLVVSARMLFNSESSRMRV